MNFVKDEHMQMAEQSIIKISTVSFRDSKSTRIGVNCSMLDEKPTGVGVYTYNLVNNLVKLYSDDNQHTLKILTPSTEFLSKDIDIIKLPGWLRSSRHGMLAAVSRFLWNTFSYPFWQNKFDVILCPTSHGNVFNNSQVLTIHDLLSLRYNNISRHQRFYFTYILPALIKRARIIVSVSEATKNDIIKYFGCPEEKIKVIYNGINALQFHPLHYHSDIISREYGVQDYLLAVGPTYPHKNFPFLIETYAKLDKDSRKLHPLVIAGGRAKYLDVLKSMVKQYKLEDCVFFLGYVPNQLMGPLYREAFALIFPSMYEGFGFPVLEAMACGCPVLAANVSSIPEVGGDAACYFDPTQHHELLAAMRKIISYTDYRNELIRKGLDRAKQFTWEKTVSGYKEIIDEYFSQN